MAAKTSEPPTPVQHIQHERFTTEQHGYQFLYLSLDFSGNIAVSGYHYSSRRTYIDLYSGNNSDSRDKLKLFYSIKFGKYSNYLERYVSFLDKNISKLVTCIGDKIEIIDTKSESKVLRSCRVNGTTECLAVREGEIFIGLYESQAVLVYNNDLEETKKIRIKGIQDGEFPWDLQVIKDTIFVCTGRYGFGRALSLSVYDGSIVSEYTDTTGMYGYSDSIAVGEKLNLVAVLWGWRRIIVYSLNKNKSFLVFDVDDDVTRIRISDRDRMIITGNRETGEIKMYSLEQLFTFEAMKRTLAYIVSSIKWCEELRKYFGVTGEEMRRLEAGDEDKDLSGKEKTVRKMEYLLIVIEEKGYLNPYNLDKLAGAVAILGDKKCISDLKGPMEGYSLHSKNMKLIRTEMMTRQKAWEDERNQLSSKLETAESKVKEHEENLDDLQDQLVQAQEKEKLLKEHQKIGELKIKDLKGERMTLKEELQQSFKQMETLTEELEQVQMKSAKEIEILTEELKQTKQSKTESDRKIETLTEELKQSKTESDRQIKTLEEELKETKRSKIESDRQVKRESHTKIEMLTEELEKTLQVLDLTKTDYANKIEALTTDLNETKQQLLTRIKELEPTNKELELTKQALKETAQDRDNTKTELRQYHLDFAKESKALKEVLNQAKEAMAELHKRPVEDKPLVEPEETRDEGGAILAAEFGRLTVAIAEHLTLDDCLRLVRFCNIPTPDCETVLRVSLIESPGMKLLHVLKKRKVINMFDVTNLQKALAVLQLEAVNHDLVAPYQAKIDKEQYELNKVEEMYTWEGKLNCISKGKLHCIRKLHVVEGILKWNRQ
ncbi:hypothetical protein HOLleu_36284 [Holothuria leucospilota]|uniref:Uncharacterized protein n=1 Tax=Holothuria leucospilota TaxID=206669 RepID=A0A9Q0YJR3_HOLLE|nr:hypothetical protein HOLleu_36284 [Holothuria leucospilota]